MNYGVSVAFPYYDQLASFLLFRDLISECIKSLIKVKCSKTTGKVTTR